MKPYKLDLIHGLVYLDRDYVSDVYEVVSDTPAKTQITKTQGKKAGAGIAAFSGEISAGETRTFSVSSTGMLEKVLPHLETLPTLLSGKVQPGSRSKVGWVEGELSVFMVERTRRESDTREKKVIASEKYFGIRNDKGTKVALLTTPEYFMSGVASFINLYETVLGPHGMRVRALVRIYPASSDFQEDLAVPLVILERDEGA